MTIPTTDAISVIAHDDPDGGYRVTLDIGGEYLTFGCNPGKAAARRLLELGYSREHVMVLRYADNSQPMTWASIGKVLSGPKEQTT
jgi:hypothetical protein